MQLRLGLLKIWWTVVLSLPLLGIGLVWIGSTLPFIEEFKLLGLSVVSNPISLVREFLAGIIATLFSGATLISTLNPFTLKAIKPTVLP